jgi:hypothetical protein
VSVITPESERVQLVMPVSKPGLTSTLTPGGIGMPSPLARSVPSSSV